MMKGTTSFLSPRQFTFFRVGFGLYLTFHFLYVLPYAKEIFSSEGMLPQAELNLTHGYFPSLLNLFDSPFAVQVFLGVLIFASVALMFGWQRPIACLILWYGWACLYDRNNLIQTPALFYVGWALLAMVLVPVGEPGSFPRSKRKPDWKFPMIIFWMAWWLLALGYTLSGFHKFTHSPSWVSGEALGLVLKTPLAGNGILKSLFIQSPVEIQKVLTWSVLLIEMAFLPLALFRGTRRWAWAAMVLVHLGILASLGFPDLTVEMLLFHWFVYDGSWAWLPSRNFGFVPQWVKRLHRAS